jgi:hypothetical protein
MAPGTTKNFTSNALRSATHHSAVLNSTLNSQHSIHGVEGPNTVVTEVGCGTPDPEDVPRYSLETKGILGKLAGRLSRTGHREGHGRGESKGGSKCEPGEFEMTEGVASGSGSGQTGEPGIRVSYNVWRTVEEA